jgi:hypothetical protein
VAPYPNLTHIPLGDLIGAAGDPWAIDDTLQSGDPGQISELAAAFRDAAACTAETWQEFGRARDRFEASWKGENGQHPIADSHEVQRAKTSLFVQAEQLPAIAIDLQNIAADLAEAQRMSDLKIDKLNGRLHYLDMLAAEALANDEDPVPIARRAVGYTATAFKGIDGYRDSYAEKLQTALTDLRLKHGYDPAVIGDVDGDGEPGRHQSTQAGTDRYDHGQRDRDEALVGGGGPMTIEKADAAARLRDSAIANDPGASPEARRLAAERLDDFRMATFVGPLPRDPVLGVDARNRAGMRLETQRLLESGYLGMPPMTVGQATQTLDDGEQLARVIAIKQAHYALTSAGMSEAGATKVVGNLVNGTGYVAKGAEEYAKAVPKGDHARVTGLSPDDARVLEKIAKQVGKVGSVIELGNAAHDWFQGGEHRNERLGAAIGKLGAGSAAAWGAAMVAGSFTGPWTTAAIALAAMYFAGGPGESLGAEVGRRFDSGGGG